MDPKDEKKEKKFQGKKGRKKEREKDPKREEKKPPYRRGPNSPEWRCSDEVMTKLVGTLPFGIAAGLSRKVKVGTGDRYLDLTFRQPGILDIRVDVTAGNTADYNSALNLVSRKIYSFVRHANSGARNYEAADLTIHLIAGGQVFALLSYLQRALAVSHNYSATNRYKPRALLETMGFDYDDFISHYPQYKYLIAWLGRAIGGIAYPKLHYFDACYEAFKYVYVDNESPKEQFYIINPDTFGIYKPTGLREGSYGGGIDFNPNLQGYAELSPISRIKYDDMYKIVHQIMDVLLSDEDIGIISGDILKAFTKEQLFVPNAFGDYDPFMKSDEVLQQIHNLTVLPKNNRGVVFHGYEGVPGDTSQAPYIRTWMVAADQGSQVGPVDFCSKLVIDAFSREPDAKEVVNCTVLNPQYKIVLGEGTNNYKVDVDNLAFDLFLPRKVYLINTIDAEITGVEEDITSFFSKISTFLLADMTQQEVRHLPLLSNFDWHPMAWWVGNSDGSLTVNADIQNINIFDYEIGFRIHENSSLSLFSFNEHNFY